MNSGAIELLARVSARLAASAEAGSEEVWIAGDDDAILAYLEAWAAEETDDA